MSPKTKKINETVEKINEKHGEETVVPASEIILKKDETPEDIKTSGQNSNYCLSSLNRVTQTDNICQVSVFEVLSKVNVNGKVESKNNMKYLSWAFAWEETKKRYPNANYKVYETPAGVNYFTDERTCWVKTGVIIEGLEHIEYLPVMDFRNKSIPVGQVTSFDVNKSIQRSLTKALARHGLGLYIYAGEDLPETEESKEITLSIVRRLYDLLSSFGKDKEKKYTENLLKKYKVENINYLNAEQIKEAIKKLNEFKSKEDKN